MPQATRHFPSRESFVHIPSCAYCGHALEGDEADPRLHETIKRVVRPGHRYGAGIGIAGSLGTGASGTEVEIEKRHVDHPSVQSSTMSIKEWKEMQERRAQPKPTPKSELKQMVDNAMTAARAQVEQSIKRGKKHLKKLEERAAEESADAERRPARSLAVTMPKPVDDIAFGGSQKEEVVETKLPPPPSIRVDDEE